MTEPTPDDYCADRVRRYDRDRFLTALFAPADRRADMIALYAFNLEIAGVRESVSEPLLGHIRIQWWRDALDGIVAGTPPDHQVAGPLSRAVRRHGLPRQRFETLLDARAADLDAAPPPTMAALESFAEDTSATVTQLALTILGVGSGTAHEIGRHVGVAWALTGLLRSVPMHAAERRVYLPESSLASAGVTAEDLLDCRRPPGLATAVAEVANAARIRLKLARAPRHKCPRAAVPALLPAVLAGVYLDRLERAEFDPFAVAGGPHAASAGPAAMVRLAASAWRGRY